MIQQGQEPSTEDRSKDGQREEKAEQGLGWLGAFLFLLFPAFFGVFFGEKVKVEKGEGECEETQRQGDGDKDVEVEVVELVHAVLVVGVEVDKAGGEYYRKKRYGCSKPLLSLLNLFLGFVA